MRTRNCAFRVGLESCQSSKGYLSAGEYIWNEEREERKVEELLNEEFQSFYSSPSTVIVVEANGLDFTYSAHWS